MTVPVARKQSTVEERPRTKGVCFEQEITQKRQKRKTILGSCLSKDCSCCSEIRPKHQDQRLFFFEEEIVETQVETPENLSKPVLNSLPDKGSSCSSETKHDRRTAQDQRRLFRREDYRYKSHNHNKSLLDLSPIKMVYAVVITVYNTVE
jgi:hypothetical protein